MKSPYTDSLAPKCRRKKVEILESEACTDHIHVYISVPPKLSISSLEDI